LTTLSFKLNQRHQRQGKPRAKWRRTAENERQKAGWRSWSKVSTAELTELVGDRVL